MLSWWIWAYWYSPLSCTAKMPLQGNWSRKKKTVRISADLIDSPTIKDYALIVKAKTNQLHEVSQLWDINFLEKWKSYIVTSEIKWRTSDWYFQAQRSPRIGNLHMENRIHWDIISLTYLKSWIWPRKEIVKPRWYMQKDPILNSIAN